MISGPELSAWLNDRARQEASFKSRYEFTRKWVKQPLFSETRRDFEAAHSLVEVRDAVQRLFARDGEIGDLMGDLIAASAADPFFAPPFTAVTSDIHSGLLLFEHPNVTVTIGVMSPDALAQKKTADRGGTSIAFTGFPNLFRFLKSGGAALSFWDAPTIDSQFTGQNGSTCAFRERREFTDGETFFMDGRCETFVIEHMETDCVYLQAIIRVDAAPLTVEYDSKTHEFVAASSTEEVSSRIQMMTTLLRLMDRVDAAPLMAEALASPHFYVRWHVMRELLALDATVALPHLRQMAARDPHSDVRAAAKKTLDAFFDGAGAAMKGAA